MPQASSLGGPADMSVTLSLCGAYIRFAGPPASFILILHSIGTQYKTTAITHSHSRAIADPS